MTWSRRWPVGPADRGRVNTCPSGTSWPGWLPLESEMRWNIRYRLRRRVIEIRDAQLILRPYSSAAAAGLAAAMARESALPRTEQPQSRKPRSRSARSDPAHVVWRAVTTAFATTILAQCRSPGCGAPVLACDDMKNDPMGSVSDTEPPCRQARDNTNPVAMRLLRRARDARAVAHFL